MSRIRTVKPELFRHEELFDAELESGLPLRLAFIGLFTVSDCEGRFQWKPRTLKQCCKCHFGLFKPNIGRPILFNRLLMDSGQRVHQQVKQRLK